MNYNSGVWGFCNDKYGNALQMRVLRYYLGVHCKALIPAIIGEFGWLTVKFQRYLNICKFWNRINNLEDTRLPKLVINNELNNEDHKGTWVNEIKDKILSIVGINDLGSGMLFDLKGIECKLLNTLEQNWKAAVLCKPKLRTYRKIKTNYETENYVKFNCTKYQRSLIAQLCMGILPLAVKIGRYTNVDLNDRKCFRCKDSIEDEFHYLPPAGREIIKRIPCVCSCVIECVSRFYKGLYITLVVSPWPFQCFL